MARGGRKGPDINNEAPKLIFSMQLPPEGTKRRSIQNGGAGTGKFYSKFPQEAFSSCPSRDRGTSSDWIYNTQTSPQSPGRIGGGEFQGLIRSGKWTECPWRINLAPPVLVLWFPPPTDSFAFRFRGTLSQGISRLAVGGELPCLCVIILESLCS